MDAGRCPRYIETSFYASHRLARPKLLAHAVDLSKGTLQEQLGNAIEHPTSGDSGTVDAIVAAKVNDQILLRHKCHEVRL